jgi:hypothetical protein
MKSFSLMMLGVVAIIAIIGLLLLFKMESTGSIIHSIEKVYVDAEKAQNAPVDRFYGAGITPEGIISTKIERKGRRPYSDVLGYEPCNEGYAIENIYTYKIGCVPVNYPRYYIGKQCCPISSY